MIKEALIDVPPGKDVRTFNASRLSMIQENVFESALKLLLRFDMHELIDDLWRVQAATYGRAYQSDFYVRAATSCAHKIRQIFSLCR